MTGMGLLTRILCRAPHLRAPIRHFSCSRIASAIPSGVSTAASVLLPRSVIAVHGPDSTKFLNGLITTRPPESATGLDHHGQYTSMLNAKGRVLADMFVYPAHDIESIQASLPTKNSCYVIEVDSSLVDKMLDILDYHVLLSDVKIDVLNSYSVFELWDDELEVDSKQFDSALLWTQDTRAPGLGYRMITASQADALPDRYARAPVDEYRIRRYLFGVPEGPNELIPGKSLPLDSCIDYMGGIDFNKGCYMGQELTIRTMHHGTVRKRIMPVVFTETPDETLPEDIYVPKDFSIEAGSPVLDQNPVPNPDAVAPIFGSSPFGNSRPSAKKRAAGEVIASLGNVGLAKMRVDTRGHDFRVGNLYMSPMTPFWWPQPAESSA